MVGGRNSKWKAGSIVRGACEASNLMVPPWLSALAPLATHSRRPLSASATGEPDRRATREAFTVPLVNPRSSELTSKRLHDYQYNPLWGFLPAQASIAN
jgi:hypothetical protein